MDNTKKKENIDKFLNARGIKPQHEWQWQVAVYLYLAGIGSGAIAMSILMYWIDPAFLPGILRPFVLWGGILVAVGALFLVLKLGVKKRFLNTVINPMSSWLSRGFYILSVCIVSGMLILIIAILPYLEPYFGFITPIMDFLDSLPSWIFTALDIIGFIFSVGTGMYTGVLIMSVKYVPFWKTFLLPSLFTVSALSTGAMAVTLASTLFNQFHGVLSDWLVALPADVVFPDGLHDTIASFELVLVIVEILVLATYIYSRYRLGSYGRYSVLLLLQGKLKYFFWGGIVVTGFIIPLILEAIYAQVEQNLILYVAGGLLLLGGFFIRYVTVYAGIKEEPPMLRLVDLRRRLKAKAPVTDPAQTGTEV